MADVKHGGCAKCGSKTEPELTSRPFGDHSEALCKECAEKIDTQRGEIQQRG